MAAEQAAAEAAKKAAMTQSEKQAAAKQYFAAQADIAAKAEAAAKVKTNPGKPAGMEAPQLKALSASEMGITWDLPAKPNGVLKQFVRSKVSQATPFPFFTMPKAMKAMKAMKKAKKAAAAPAPKAMKAMK